MPSTPAATPLNPMDPLDSAGWAQWYTSHPASRTALEAARALATLTVMVAQDDARFAAGEATSRVPLDPALRQTLLEIEHAPSPQWDPKPAPPDPSPSATLSEPRPDPPWHPEHQAWLERVHATRWFNPPAQRLWRGVTKLTVLAGRLEAHTSAYYRSERPDLPTAPEGLTSTAWLQDIDAAVTAFPEAVRQRRTTSDPAPEPVSPTPASNPAPVPEPSANAVPTPPAYCVAKLGDRLAVLWRETARDAPIEFVRETPEEPQSPIRRFDSVADATQAGQALNDGRFPLCYRPLDVELAYYDAMAEHAMALTHSLAPPSQTQGFYLQQLSNQSWLFVQKDARTGQGAIARNPASPFRAPKVFRPEALAADPALPETWAVEQHLPLARIDGVLRRETAKDDRVEAAIYQETLRVRAAQAKLAPEPAPRVS